MDISAPRLWSERWRVRLMLAWLSRPPRWRAKLLRPLLKDPIALFSAPWLARQANAQVVIVIRHPAALIASRLRMGWPFDMRTLTGQRRLLSGHLAEVSDYLRSVEHTEDRVEQAIALWMAVYAAVRSYQREFPEWTFIRHEDLCAGPMDGFRQLSTDLKLPWGPELTAAVAASQADHEPDDQRSQHRMVRQSADLPNQWRQTLDPATTARIRQRTGPLVEHFYGPDSW